MHSVWLALQATAFPCFCTALGAASVFVVGGGQSPAARRCMDGFAGGVMMAASVFSLLLPAINAEGKMPWLIASAGLMLGAVALLLVERITESSLQWQPDHAGRVAVAIALHNLPEGMVVGLAVALAAQQGGGKNLFAGAAALAFGIGLQNLPEGAAVSLPMHQSGKSSWRSFAWGAASGLVEPMGGVLAALLVGVVAGWMPLLLCLAAGAMVCVSVQELIPSAAKRMDGTLSFLAGFALMMALDVALG